MKWLRSWLEGRRARRDAAGAPRAKLSVLQSLPGARDLSLADMRPGETAIVDRLDGGEENEIEKCLALGIVPGASITLRRRSPAFVFDIGFSKFAVDERIARAVLVVPTAPG